MKISDKELEKIYRENTVVEAAAILGVSRVTVINEVRRRGIPLKGQKGRKSAFEKSFAKWTVGQVEKIYHKNTNAKAAEILGVSLYFLDRFVKENNIKKKGCGPAYWGSAHQKKLQQPDD